jgi:hypothetical protein
MTIMRKGALDGRRQALEMQQGLAYSTAVLIAIAVNNPKKLPSFEKAFPSGRPKRQMSADEIMRNMQAWTIIEGGNPHPEETS